MSFEIEKVKQALLEAEVDIFESYGKSTLDKKNFFVKILPYTYYIYTYVTLLKGVRPLGARGRIKGLGACWVPKGWGGFDCLFPCRAKARRCAEQSEARRKFGEFDPHRCLFEQAAEYFF